MGKMDDLDLGMPLAAILDLVRSMVLPNHRRHLHQALAVSG